MTYSAPAVLATVDTAEVLDVAYGWTSSYSN